MEDGEIIQLLEQSSENSKIIQFDDAFQKCLNCGGELPSKADYSFALDIDGEFHIGEDDYDFSNGEAFKFAGVYHGYFCSKCKNKLINLLSQKIKQIYRILKSKKFSMNTPMI